MFRTQGDDVVADSGDLDADIRTRRTGERLTQAVDGGEIRAGIDPDGQILQLARPAMLAAAVSGPGAASKDRVERIAAVILDRVRPPPLRFS